MKRLSVLFLMLCCAFMLIGCGTPYDSDDINHAYRSGRDEGYDEGYSDGYDEGYYDAERETRSDYNSRTAYNEAESFVHSVCEYSAEEASMIVSDYLYGTDYWGSRPTQQEFYDAVEALEMFFMYFY